MQAHELPLLRPQRPLPLPDAGRDGHPAEVVKQAGAVRRRLDRLPGFALAAAWASRATPPEWPWNHGVLRSAASPNPARASSRAASSRNVRRGARLGIDDRRPQVVRVRKLQQLRRRLLEDRRDRRIERAARPAGDRLGRGVAAADRVEHHGRVADGRKPRRLGNVGARPARGHAAPVEALEPVEHGPADSVGQPQPAGEVGADLAVGARALGDELGHGRGAAQDPQAAGAVAEAREQPHRLRRPGRVDQVAARPDNDVVAAERRGELVRRRGTAGEPQERRVVDVAPAGLAEPRPPRELGREQARSHRLARRMSASQVTRHRQRRDDTTDAGGLAHERDSIPDRQSPCAGAWAAGARAAERAARPADQILPEPFGESAQERRGEVDVTRLLDVRQVVAVHGHRLQMALQDRVHRKRHEHRDQWARDARDHHEQARRVGLDIERAKPHQHAGEGAHPREDQELERELLRDDVAE